MKIILTFCVLLFSSSVFSNEELFGSWKSDNGIRIDIIDGFKPNVGPVIYWEDDELSEVRTWKVNPNSKELSISWSSGNFNISNAKSASDILEGDIISIEDAFKNLEKTGLFLKILQI